MCKNGANFRLSKWIGAKGDRLLDEGGTLMLSVNHFLAQVLHPSKLAVVLQTSQAQATSQPDQEIASWRIQKPFGGEELSTGVEEGLETNRDVAGASLSQLIDALSAAIALDIHINGDHVLVALAEAAVLERELSGQSPRRWRIQQALNALLKMGPHVTVALAAVLEHPSAMAHIARLFSD